MQERLAAVLAKENIKIMHRLHSSIRIILAFLTLSHVSPAQSTFGSINGSILDSSQSALPAVVVDLRNLDDNSSRKTTTSDDGSFQFLNLKPGNYRITASKDGFAETKSGTLALTSRQQLRADLTMQIAAVNTETSDR